jgi:hypothetical protein
MTRNAAEEAVLNWVRAQRGTVKGQGITMRVVGDACFVIDRQHQKVKARGVEPKTLAMGRDWADVARQLKIKVEEG